MPAEWKKVIVSGSSAHLSELKVGSNQQIGTTQATTFLTGSFSGSGAGLTGVTNATTLASLTQGTGITMSSFNGSAATTVALKNAGSLTNNLITKWDSGNGQLVNSTLTDNGSVISTTLPIQSTGATSVLSGSFSGNGAGLSGVTATFPTTPKTDLATTDQFFINDGGNKYITYGNLVTDLAGTGSTSNLTTTDTGDSLALTAQVTVTGVTASLFGTAATASFVTLGNVSGLAANVATFLGNPTSANFATAVTGETGTAGSVVFSVDPTFTGTVSAAAISTSGNVTVGGDLTVNGTTTILDTTNLSVEDRFIILNHGSGSVSPSAEGGIIVEGNGTPGSGSAFFYDGDTVLRWGVALGVAEGATAVTANSYVVTVSGSTVNPGIAAPTYGGSAGYGNMYVNTQDNTIWIYA